MSISIGFGAIRS